MMKRKSKEFIESCERNYGGKKLHLNIVHVEQGIENLNQ